MNGDRVVAADNDDNDGYDDDEGVVHNDDDDDNEKKKLGVVIWAVVALPSQSQTGSGEEVRKWCCPRSPVTKLFSHGRVVMLMIMVTVI